MEQNTLPHPTLRRELTAAFDPSRLSLIISPTEKCNFRCTYCYEDFLQGRMSSRVYGALRLYVAKQMPNLRWFSLSWFGGEPLLCAEMVESFTEYCRELALQRGVVMPGASITTNGWNLSYSLLKRLLGCGVTNYQISLDGEEGVHDATRKLANGAGTFERVYGNLLAAREIDKTVQMTISIRLHLHTGNLDSQFALARRIARDFGSDTRFVIFPKRICDLGSSGVKTLRLLSSGNAVEAEIWRHFRSHKSPPHATASEPALPHVCYAAKPNNLFIRPSGRLAKCTVALDHDDNDIGHLNVDGEIEINTEKALLWSCGFRTGRVEDLACPLSRKATAARVNIHRQSSAADGSVSHEVH